MSVLKQQRRRRRSPSSQHPLLANEEEEEGYNPREEVPRSKQEFHPSLYTYPSMPSFTNHFRYSQRNLAFIHSCEGLPSLPFLPLGPDGSVPTERPSIGWTFFFFSFPRFTPVLVRGSALPSPGVLRFVLFTAEAWRFGVRGGEWNCE